MLFPMRQVGKKRGWNSQQNRTWSSHGVSRLGWIICRGTKYSFEWLRYYTPMVRKALQPQETHACEASIDVPSYFLWWNEQFGLAPMAIMHWPKEPLMPMR